MKRQQQMLHSDTGWENLCALPPNQPRRPPDKDFKTTVTHVVTELTENLDKELSQAKEESNNEAEDYE